MPATFVAGINRISELFLRRFLCLLTRHLWLAYKAQAVTVPFMKNTHIARFVRFACVALVAGTILPTNTPALAGGVPGPCGTLSGVTASNVALTKTAAGYTASLLSLRGGLSNCSSNMQRYILRFSEPARPVSGGFDPFGPVVTCTTNAGLLPQAYVSSSGSLGWNITTSITPTAVTDPKTCTGTHIVRVELHSRTDNSLLAVSNVSYVVK